MAAIRGRGGLQRNRSARECWSIPQVSSSPIIMSSKG
jgi:hypothetical protein